MSNSEVIPEGTPCVYTGSVSEHHGKVMEYVGSHPCYSGSGEIKHTLWCGPGMNDGVDNIRRASFSLLEDMSVDEG